MKYTGLMLLSLAVAGCSRRTPDSEFSCENLQHRAMQCQQDTLDLIKRRMSDDAAEGSATERDRQFAMLERRMRQRLESGGTRKQCEKFSAPGGSARVEMVRRCYARSGCALFAECMLELDQ